MAGIVYMIYVLLIGAWKTLSSDERGQAVSEFLNVVEKWNEVATAKKVVTQCIQLLAKKLILCL